MWQRTRPDLQIYSVHTRHIVAPGSPSENKLTGSVIILTARSLHTHTHTATNIAMYRFGNL